MKYLALALCFLLSIALTPIAKKIAIKIGAVDQPNDRKVHNKLMPRLGGVAIFVSFIIGFVIFNPDSPYFVSILIGAILIATLGFFDDIYDLSPFIKFGVQFLAAIIVVLDGAQIDHINLPMDKVIELGYFSIPVTILWVVGITNAINLIDGLDGLAAGVSSIALITISGLAITQGYAFSAFTGFLLLGSTLGFLVYNFHPAKIFMGDTGALFLGYLIGVLSILGFKNATLFSLIVPITILGVPILDTFFAIVRRFVNKQPFYTPDKLHLHHGLLRLGFGHRQTVILIYCMSSLFSLAAIILTKSTLWGSTITFFALAILIEVVVELTGLVSESYRPLLKIFQKKS